MAEDTLDLLDHQPYPKAWAIASIITGFLSVATGIYALFFLGCLLFSTGTYRNVPKAIRKQSYNAYLIFLIIPDVLVNLMSGIAKIYEGFNDGKYMHLCLARNGLNYFYYFANLWLNAVVAHQVYRMVVFSHQRRKTSPPKMSTALAQIAAVYFCCGLLAAWFIAEVPWSPYTTTDEVYCHTNVGSELIGKWMATGIALSIIFPPVAYVAYVYWVIWKKKLLPKSGRTRALFVYFLRILVVYLAFYVPNACVAVCIVTVRMACEKADIGQAVSKTRSDMVKGVSKRVSSHLFSSATFQFSAESGGPSSSFHQQAINEGPTSSETSAALPPVDSNSTSDVADSKKGGITTASSSSRGVPTSEWDLDDTYEESHEGDEEQHESNMCD